MKTFLTAVLLGGLCFAQVPETVARLEINDNKQILGPAVVLRNTGTKPIAAVALWTSTEPPRRVSNGMTPGLEWWNKPLMPGAVTGADHGTTKDPTRIRLLGVVWSDGTFAGNFTREDVDRLHAIWKGEALEFERWENIANEIAKPGQRADRAARELIDALRNAPGEDIPATNNPAAFDEQVGRNSALNIIRGHAYAAEGDFRDDPSGNTTWARLKTVIGQETKNARSKAVAK